MDNWLKSDHEVIPQIKHIFELLKDHEVYVENSQDYPQFFSIFKERIFAKYRELKKMNKASAAIFIGQKAQEIKNAQELRKLLGEKAPPKCGTTSHSLPNADVESEMVWDQAEFNVDWDGLDTKIKKLLENGALFRLDIVKLYYNYNGEGIELLKNYLSDPDIYQAAEDETLPLHAMLEHMSDRADRMQALTLRLLDLKKNNNWDFELVNPADFFSLLSERYTANHIDDLVHYISYRPKLYTFLAAKTFNIRNVMRAYSSDGSQLIDSLLNFLDRRAIRPLINNCIPAHKALHNCHKIELISELILKKGGIRLLKSRLMTFQDLITVIRKLPNSCKQLIARAADSHNTRLRTLLKKRVFSLTDLANLGKKWRRLVNRLKVREFFVAMKERNITLQEAANCSFRVDDSQRFW